MLHLTVIAKQPVPGAVKTRLCPPCTPEMATQVAGAALADTLDAVEQVVELSDRSVVPVLLFDGDPSQWLRPGWRHVAQHGDGLAERLAHAFHTLGAGALIGMEVPEGVVALAPHLPALDDGVDLIGLAVDGGYWMIGLHRPDGAVFEGIPMSTSNTGMAQLRRMHQLGRAVRLMPMEHDLDTEADLRLAARTTPGRRLAATARAVLGIE